MPPPFSDKDVVRAMAHPDVIQAFGHYEGWAFIETPGAIYAFWANDIEDTPTGTVHHGRKMAQSYRDCRSVGEVYLMENFEGKGDVLRLDGYERIQSDKHIRDAVAAAASYSYAKSASGTVLVSVKGALPSSYFREVELDLILKNESIADIIVVSRDDPGGTRHSKLNGYHVLRDEWLENSINRFNKAKANELSTPELYKEAARSLAKEIVLAERNKAIVLPFSVGNPAQHELDKGKEDERIAKVADLIRDSYVLREAVESEKRNVSKSFAQTIISEHERQALVAKKVVSSLTSVIVSGAVVSSPPPSPLPQSKTYIRSKL